jgi:hypothetical protein
LNKVTENLVWIRNPGKKLILDTDPGVKKGPDPQDCLQRCLLYLNSPVAVCQPWLPVLLYLPEHVAPSTFSPTPSPLGKKPPVFRVIRKKRGK